MNKISNRIDNITRISAPYMGTVLPAPKSVKIEITATCNYHCSFCTKSLNQMYELMGLADRPVADNVKYFLDLYRTG